MYPDRHTCEAFKNSNTRTDIAIRNDFLETTYQIGSHGVSTQLQSSGLVAHENSTFRNLALAVSGPFMA